ncbi:Type-F conjugative transfer system pilin assembly protein TraF [Vibrio nigripulchritudo SO65]|nr:conjugal transfer protein TraF [Vibrio nigripulchritudo]BDU46813.1 conjugal transfer protein TraF [Vibrio nigripulchritudo]CCN38670.1 Type-F conjugative transfer system pilin assembly protein TraF [Vibrio nigripulchritudo AM115]CCN44979.1 Type-F conjugative transfer system pilin assembly protein TraF [Vibrio nigripulchritudo FTn2]CCN79737.1 Type-F conjugative transfer system pilin assembly protein TraF [Vibrio nigripulchritudo SO65]
MKASILIRLLVLYPTLCLATTSPQGWRWYNEPAEPKVLRRPSTGLPPNTVTTVMTATEQMDWFHATYQEALNAATLDPGNPEKYLTVMRMHHFIGEKVSQTGMTFKQLLLTHPELSYVRDRPVQQAARGPYLARERQKKTEIVTQLVDRGWGLMFVYRGNDAISQRLAPSLQQFADAHQFELLGVSEDDTFIDAVRHNRRNRGKVTVPYTPAILMVHPKTAEFKPLAYGFISQSELLSRVYNAATDYRIPDF